MQWVRLGLVGKTYRLDGSFFVSERDTVIPKTVKWLVLTPPALSSPAQLSPSAPRYGLNRSRPQAKRVIARLAELTSIEAITPFIGHALWTTRDQIPLDSSDEYLWADLPGRSLVDAEGTAFGTITTIQNFGAGDVVEVRSPEGHTMMMPFSDYYVDMDFAPEEGPIRLVVPGEIFAEFWEAPPQPKNKPAQSKPNGKKAQPNKKAKADKGAKP